MNDWHLHEFAIETDSAEPFLELWRTRLIPLAERHGPSVVGCWTVNGQNRFVWLTQGEVRGKADALAEDWPAILMRHEQLGTMDISVPLRAFPETVSFDWTAERNGGRPDIFFELLEYRATDGDRFVDLLKGHLLPLLTDYGITVNGAWHGHDRFFLLIAFRDQKDAARRFADLREDARWPAYQAAEAQLVAERRNRFMTICDFSPAGPFTTSA